MLTLAEPFVTSWLQLIISVISSVGFLFVSYLGIKIRSTVSEIRLEQAAVKETLVAAQTRDRDSLQTKLFEVQQLFADKVSQIAQTMAVHAAEDHLNFSSIRESLASLSALAQTHTYKGAQSDFKTENVEAQLKYIKETLDNRKAVVVPANLDPEMAAAACAAAAAITNVRNNKKASDNDPSP